MNRLSVYSYLTRYTHGNTIELVRCTQDDWGTLFSDNWTTGQLDLRTNPGPPFQDLTSGWIQPESDNNPTPTDFGNNYVIMCWVHLTNLMSCSTSYDKVGPKNIAVSLTFQHFWGRSVRKKMFEKSDFHSVKSTIYILHVLWADAHFLSWFPFDL